MKKTVMLLSGESRRTLAMTRSFAKKKITVFVGGTGRLSRSFFSKYCKTYFKYPKIVNNLFEAHDTILKNVKKLEPDVLIPCGITDSMIIFKYKKEYQEFTNLPPLVDEKTFSKVNDKEILYKVAKKHRIPQPLTYFPQNKEEVKQISNNITYPILIKPRISEAGIGIEYACNQDELLKKYEKITKFKSYLYPDFKKPLLQECIPNKTIAVNILFHKKKILAKMMRRTLRNYPQFGAPIYTMTIKDERIEKLAIKLLKRLDWEGVVDLQFITDPKDNVPKLVDLNPRIWGTIESSIAVGVDFPYMLYQLALEERVEPIPKYPLGKTFRCICFGEFAYLLTNKNKIQVLKELLNFKNDSYDFSFKDLKPHLAHLMNLILFKQVL